MKKIGPLLGIVFLSAFVFLNTGCDKILRPGSKSLEQGEQAEKAKDYTKAVRYYEAALDGTAVTAEAHYRLAAVYDDKLKDPVAALHHYRRYTHFLPASSKANEVKHSIKRIETMLVADLGEGMPISRAEAVRLKNDNMALRQEMAELKAADKRAANTKASPANPATAKTDKSGGKGSRTYVVEKGDTLAAISRKFYKTSARWKDVADANHNQLGGKENLKTGMTLIIPQ
ncbi:MAG: LysM peptidoglycan-binding domain-containing protein [Chthoniobacterales bacterium]